MLTSTLSSLKLARELNCSPEAVNGIRRGAFHRETLPELPRRRPRGAGVPIASCLLCGNWRGGGCSIGFPDPIDEGPAFAADCALYEPRTHLTSRV